MKRWVVSTLFASTALFCSESESSKKVMKLSDLEQFFEEEIKAADSVPSQSHSQMPENVVVTKTLASLSNEQLLAGLQRLRENQKCDAVETVASVVQAKTDTLPAVQTSNKWKCTACGGSFAYKLTFLGHPGAGRDCSGTTMRLIKNKR